MAKRAREPSPSRGSVAKRTKLLSVDRLSRLSDELILRILSFLPVTQLVVCQRYYALGGDDQLWKALYFDRFVRPRAKPVRRRDSDGRNNGSKSSKWLDNLHLTAKDAKTDWKKQYKLRHNWTQGSCTINEIEVAEQAAIPPVLVQLQDSVIYMADLQDGMRAWSAKGERKMLAHTQMENVSSPPTSLSVDGRAGQDGGSAKLIVGFEDGGYGVYSLDVKEKRFIHHYNHEASSNGVISASAVSWPYVATMTAAQLLSLYRFNDGAGVLNPPRLLHSLQSHTVWPPLSVSLRASKTSITISIAYAIPTYLSGWTVGLQEVGVTPEGDFLHSRLASAIDQHYRPLACAAPPMVHHLASTTGTLATFTTLELRHIHSKPVSLSYTHPYLLVSHPDNTLTLYLVASTADQLSISPGSRLWGHTSSVSGAHVGGRGKAVSVSTRGDELRVWELEGGFSSLTARKRLASGDLSVQIRSDGRAAHHSSGEAALVSRAIAARGSGACAKHAREDLTLTRGWIGFDDENVVVLKEQSRGRQALVVYDFT